MARARIVSDYPILAAAAERMLEASFEVERTTWAQYEGADQDPDVDLVLLDVTQVAGDRVLALVSRLLPAMRVLVTSLDRNQVDVYEISQDGLARQGELPSLLALGA